MVIWTNSSNGGNDLRIFLLNFVLENLNDEN